MLNKVLRIVFNPDSSGKSRLFSGKKQSNKSCLSGKKGKDVLSKVMVALVLIMTFATYLVAYDPNIDWDYPHEDCTQGDWRSEWHWIYYPGNMPNDPSFYPTHSPFYTLGSDHLTHIAYEDDSDFQTEDGWELLAVDLGNPDGYDLSIPFFALYNRYLGIIRVFVASIGPYVSGEDHNATLIIAEYKDNNTAVLSHASENMYLQAADKRNEENGNIYCKAINQGGIGWYYADFDVMYDPIERDYGVGYLAFHLKGYDEWNINLDFVSSTLSTSSENAGSGFDPFTFGNMVNSHWKDSGDWLENFDDVANGEVSWFDDYNDTFMDPIIDAGVSLAGELQSTGLPALIPYANVVFGIYNFFSGGGRSNTDIARSIIASLVEDVQITGTMTGEDEIDDFAFYEPITGQTGGSGGRALDPVYPYTLGTFNLESTPVLEYRECEFLYFNPYPTYVPYRSYRVQDDIEYIINPDCGLKTSVEDMEIAIRFYIDWDNGLSYFSNLKLMLKLQEWAASGYYSKIASKDGGYPDGTEIWQTEFIDYEEFKHTVINAPDFAHVVFKIKSVLEAEDNPNLEPILFMADYYPDQVLVSGDEPFPYSPGQQIVVLYENTTFTGAVDLDYHLQVAPGITLTLDNCTLNIDNDFGMTVNSGNLIVDNSELNVNNGYININASEMLVENNSGVHIHNEITLSGGSLIEITSGSLFRLHDDSFLIGTDHTVYVNPATGQRYDTWEEAYGSNPEIGAEDAIPGDRIITSYGGHFYAYGSNSSVQITISAIGDNIWDGIELNDPSDGNGNWLNRCNISKMRYIKVNNSDLNICNSNYINGNQIIAQDNSCLFFQNSTFNNFSACPIVCYESELVCVYCTINNTLEGNGISIHYPPEENNSLYGNDIMNNMNYGVYYYDTPVISRHNNIIGNGSHGIVVLGSSGTPIMQDDTISNNEGAEIIGTRTCFPDIASEAFNTIEDDVNSGGADNYLLMCGNYDGTRIDVRGNNFPNEDDDDFEDRFFPSYEAYIFDGEKPPEKILYEEGIAEIADSVYESAKLTMKEIVDIYPETETAKNALQWLMYLEKFSGHDYVSLRAYIENINDVSYPHLERTKYNTITSTYMAEKDYEAAITRFESILANPPSVADSIFAYIDEGYCYLKLDEEGGKAAPVECKFKPRSFEEFSYVSQNLTQNLLDKAIPTSEPPTTDPQTVEFALNQNYPNPFHTSTTISFSLPLSTQKAELKIYNIKGQLVKTFIPESNEKGTTDNLKWDCKDENGKTLSNGIYFYKLTADKKEIVKKMILLR